MKVEITDPDAQLLRPRMSGDAEIVTETLEQAVIVPETALRYRGEEILVDLALSDQEAAGEENQTASERIVKIGIIDGDRVQITEGLAAGEEVFLQ